MVALCPTKRVRMNFLCESNCTESFIYWKVTVLRPVRSISKTSKRLDILGFSFLFIALLYCFVPRPFYRMSKVLGAFLRILSSLSSESSSEWLFDIDAPCTALFAANASLNAVGCFKMPVPLLSPPALGVLVAAPVVVVFRR